MSDREPTNAELLASAAIIISTGRRIIDQTNRCLPSDMLGTMDALNEHLAVAGDALSILADRLGHQREVEQSLKEGQYRVSAFRASQGLEGGV